MKKTTTLLQLLESLKTDESIYFYNKVEILLQIAQDYELQDVVVDQIVSEETIDDIVRSYFNNKFSWENLAIFFNNIRLLGQPYYFLNGYQNLENLSLRQFNIILEDFISEVKYRGLANEIIEKEK